MKFEWETISSQVSSYSGVVAERAPIFGGWVVRNITWDDDYNAQSEAMVFVPDPNHEWKIEE